MKYTVRFHFPNTSVIIEGVSERELNSYDTCFRQGAIFEVEVGPKRMTINPLNMTYMEATKDTF